MLEKMKQDFRPITWVLILIAIVINTTGGWLITKLGLPLYMDTVGTILVAIVAGPLAGAFTGLLSNFTLELVLPGIGPYWLVPILIGLAAGFFANLGWFRHWWKVLLAGLIISVVASVTSTAIAMYLYDNVYFDPRYFLLKEPVDKIATTLIAFGIGSLLPKRILALLPRRENLSDKGM